MIVSFDKGTYCECSKVEFITNEEKKPFENRTNYESIKAEFNMFLFEESFKYD